MVAGTSLTDQAVTVGMVLWPVLIIGGLLALAGVCIFLLYILNPFRSGH